MPVSHRLARRGFLSLAAAAFAFAGAPAQAQAQAFPSKPIKWIVGYPAGGGSDFLARTIGAQMSVQAGQPVIVDNRAGAGAIIGAEVTARSPGDGYTVFTADNGVLVYNPALYKKLPYAVDRDFAMLGLMARTPLVLVAAPSTNLKTIGALMEQLKSKPGTLSYASPGNGSPHHLAMELFLSRSGLSTMHVPYRGAAPALQDVMGGQVPLMVVDTSSGLSAIQSGKVIPLMAFSAKRLPILPAVPTVGEQGFKDSEAYAWQGLVVPASTPAAIQERLSKEMQAAVGNESVRKKLQEGGWEPVPSDSVLMKTYAFAETKKWHALIRERGISLD